MGVGKAIAERLEDADKEGDEARIPSNCRSALVLDEAGILAITVSGFTWPVSRFNLWGIFDLLSLGE